MNRPLRLAEWFVGISWVNVDILRSVGWAFRGMFATLLQSVSSEMAIRQQLQGPIYRARVYGNTHEMGNGNAYLIMWKHIFGYGNTRF